MPRPQSMSDEASDLVPCDRSVFVPRLMPDPRAALTDDAARRAAITVHDRTFLVEAGAGSGKTAVLAGRIAMMLAGGIAPKHIAAVTFTELAASELLIRVRHFADSLLEDKVPNELRVALPEGLSADQRTHLNSASETLDEITCSTIHGFCQHLIKPYPVAANIDPGAAIMDRDQADMTFDEVVDAWLKDHLNQEDQSLLGNLVWQDRDETLKLIRTTLKHLRRYRELRVRNTLDFANLLETFHRAVHEFREFTTRVAVEEQDTLRFADAFFQLAESTRPDPSRDEASNLLKIVLAERDPLVFIQAGGIRVYKKKGKWQKAASAHGHSKAEGAVWFDNAKILYDACGSAWESICESACSRLLELVLEEVRPALQEYREHKRSTAQLDFDDLIYSACDLLRNHEDIRQALGKRYAHLLVDEFQDTDPLQTEIFWRLCGDPPKRTPTAEKDTHPEGTPTAPKRTPTGEAQKGTPTGDNQAKNGTPTEAWPEFQIRPGALFLVGDPKQAIYRFRGADVAAYLRARDALLEQDPEALLHISTNFRSREPILEYVNQRFEEPLSEINEQPGFTSLNAFRPAPDGRPCVATLAVQVKSAEEGTAPSVDAERDGEAEAVAELCARLIGSYVFQDADGKEKVCEPGDIALLAPTGTDLWRYEESLEDRRIPVATQAGKGLFRRQEIQDLIALTRVLADSRDTLALGALLRGPLVGLSEEELLDLVAASAQRENEEGVSRIHVNLNADSIDNAHAKDIFEKLQTLRRKAASTTPHDLLSQAIDLLRVRPILMHRHHGQVERVLANVDLFLSMSRAYAVRGLRAFSEAMTRAWSDESRSPEGRPDAQEESVALFTMHAAKGLEWPILVPVNTMTKVKSVDSDITDKHNGYLYCRAFGALPENYNQAKSAEQSELDREHVRLWYVACTRAKELLVLPKLTVSPKDSAWIRLLDLDLEGLPSIDLEEMSADLPSPAQEVTNKQTREVFAEEAGRISLATRKIIWRTPSRGEDASEPAIRTERRDAVFLEEEADSGQEAGQVNIRGGHERGTIIHKLFEEVLTGEIGEVEADLTDRAEELILQMGKEALEDPSEGLVPSELAACVTRGLALPEVAELRPRLVPEFSLFGSRQAEDLEEILTGVADAIAIGEDGRAEVVIDWKTDVNPSDKTLDHYREQLAAYMQLAEAERGLIVLVTSAKLIRVQRNPEGSVG